MEELMQKLEKYFPLAEPARSEFRAIWKEKSYPKGHFLLREGHIGHYMYYISRGIARIYYHKQDREITEWLAMDGTFFFSISSFFTGSPSHLIIHLLENATVFSMHHDDLMALCDRHHSIEKLFRRMVTHSLLLSQVRMESIQFETAQQRYHRLVADNPDIVQRVPLGYIATFLGITQETLSRIRAQPITFEG